MESHLPNEQDLSDVKSFRILADQLPDEYFSKEDTIGYYGLDDKISREEAIAKFLQKRKKLIEQTNELLLNIHVFIKNRYGVESGLMTKFQEIAFYEEQTLFVTNFFNERKNELWRSGKHSLRSLLTNLDAEITDQLRRKGYQDKIEKEIHDRLKIEYDKKNEKATFYWRLSLFSIILLVLLYFIWTIDYNWLGSPINKNLSRIAQSISCVLLCSGFIWPQKRQWLWGISVSFLVTSFIIMKV